MFERASTIIRDGSKLDYAYIPANLVHREEQMARLETLFRPLAESGRPCTAFLTGSVGTGKTVTATRFSMDLADYMAKAGRPIDTVYVNCRNTSEAGALLQILRHYDRGFPDRGFSADEMARAMASHLATGERAMLVILDEVDVLEGLRGHRLPAHQDRHRPLRAGVRGPDLAGAHRQSSGRGLDVDVP